MSENASAEFRKAFIQCSENLEVLILQIYHSDVLFWGPIGFPILHKFTILLSYNVIYCVTAHDLATDHAKSTQAPGAGMLNYPTHKLNFHSLPATTQPWAE
jgi:hypothetical protein